MEPSRRGKCRHSARRGAARPSRLGRPPVPSQGATRDRSAPCAAAEAWEKSSSGPDVTLLNTEPEVGVFQFASELRICPRKRVTRYCARDGASAQNNCERGRVSHPPVAALLAPLVDQFGGTHRAVPRAEQLPAGAERHCASALPARCCTRGGIGISGRVAARPRRDPSRSPGSRDLQGSPPQAATRAARFPRRRLPDREVDPEPPRSAQEPRARQLAVGPRRHRPRGPLGDGIRRFLAWGRRSGRHPRTRGRRSPPLQTRCLDAARRGDGPTGRLSLERRGWGLDPSPFWHAREAHRRAPVQPQLPEHCG